MNKYLARANDLLAAGFSTKTARNDAAALAGRAYEAAVNQINELCLKVIHADGETPAAVSNLYASFPYTLNNYRAKHGAAAVAVFPEAAPFVAQIEEAFALRARIVATEITPKAKEDKSSAAALATASKTQVRGICQCCGREQAVVRGNMAKHGYTVEQGWFNGVCSGEHYAPMQVSRERADQIVAQVRREVEELKVQVVKIARREADPTSVQKPGEYVRRGEKPTFVEFASLPAYQQADVIRQMVWNTENRIRMGTSFADQLEALANRVHGTELKTVKVA